MNKALIVGLVAMFAQNVFAAEMKAKDDVTRTEMIRRGIVWEKPDWITENGGEFVFSSKLDVLKGSPVKGNQTLLEADDVYCQMTKDDLQKGSGRTPKFTCRLMQKDPKTGELKLVTDEKGGTDKIKVKYTAIGKKDYNPEVFSEVVGTRLLWALGFGADRMFPVKRLHCLGCTNDPFNDLTLNPASDSEATAVVFNTVAIEKKAKGAEVLSADGKTSGFEFRELMATYPKDPAGAYYQYTYRDALRLLAAVLQHTDNKSENQKILCLDKDLPPGANDCLGKVQLLIQDIGTTFGVGLLGLSINKFDLAKWSQKPVWADVPTCASNIGRSMDRSVEKAQISNAGRAHLAKLLKGFIKGEEGRKRVQDMFRAAQVEARTDADNDLQGWTEAFISKANQVIFPAGESNPDFKCKQ